MSKTYQFPEKDTSPFAGAFRLRAGVLVMPDGSDSAAHLLSYQQSTGLADGSFITIMPQETMVNMVTNAQRWRDLKALQGEDAEVPSLDRFPRRLQLVAGVVCLADGSDVAPYLQAYQIKCRHTDLTGFVLAPTPLMEQQAAQAMAWQDHIIRQMAADERFAFAA
jgi:hypothetical protein